MESSTQPPASDPLDPFPQRSLEPGDIAVLVLYFLFVLAVGLWSTVKTKRDTVKGYFLAGGNMVWWPVGASLFASNIGSGHFVGLAGSGAASGISVAAYELNGMFSVLMLAWIFLPIYIAGQVTTMPEYLRKRFGGSRIAITLAVLYLFIYIFTKISVDMYAGAIFIQQSLHLDLYLSVIGLLVITALYTIAGGLAVVIYTDALQTLIMLVGALTLMGYSDCPAVTGCQEPVPCQRRFSDGLIHEGAAPFHHGVSWDGEPHPFSRPSGLRRPRHLSEGLRQPLRLFRHRLPQAGAGAPAHSASTIFTMDLWNHVRPRASERELMIVGRVFVLLLVVVSVLWIPVVQASQGGQLFVYIQAISSYLQPPVAVVFIMGCFWKRTNEKGAFWGLILGLLLGFLRLILDFIYVQPTCDQPDERPSVVKSVHYLYFSMILSSVTLVTLTATTLLTEPPSQEMISRLTWFTRHDPVVQKQQQGAAATPGPPAFCQNGTTETHRAGIQLEMVQEGASKTHSGDATPQQSKVLSAILWLCGVASKSAEVPPSPAEPTLASLEENTVVKRALDINCLLCICCAFFMWGYFA
ncbi:sodium/myo-inositol cotransporter 2 isoform X3 [Ochotona princeps]|uniref:sodium/myo-inositol cotransporter 2 isoform X3 n=1 Tax=Ochotona princeps TaxID=9978 RepID=UPI0027148A46|nr:sodium/myo-inositol cotransporter 2 isoform X3 [Ochotona princeps]